MSRILPSMRYTKPQVEGNVGTFVYSPLAPGYAITIGNSLRRVLLSSVPSCGIYGVFIPGITHQYATIEGIKEDALHIIQNLKKIRFKIQNEGIDDIIAKIDFKGPGTVTSNDILQNDESLSVITPSSYICSVFDKIDFECNIYIKRGVGYIGLGTSELDVEKQFAGFIPINSIANAVLNVSFEIKNIGHAGHTDYEELTLKIITDGSITPVDAMNKAAMILTQNFAVIGNLQIDLAQNTAKHITEVLNEKSEQKDDNSILSSSIRSLDIPTNICALLEEAGIYFACDLVKKTKSELMELPKLGARKISQIYAKLLEYGLNLKE